LSQFSAQQTISNPAPNVSTDNIRYLFTGIDNPVTITTGCDGKYEVSISKGRIINQGNEHFIVNPSYDTSEVTIKVKAGKKEFDFVFNVRDIPDPEIMVGNYEGHPIYFKQTAGVRAFVKNIYYKTQFSIVSFDIEFSGPGFDMLILFSSNGTAYALYFDNNYQMLIQPTPLDSALTGRCVKD